MNPLFKSLIYCFLGLFSFASFSQTAVITGILKDEQGAALIYANIGLFHSADSSLAKASNSNEAGHFEFKDLANGSYYLKSTYVGMEDFQHGGISLQNNASLDLGVLKMTTASINLKETTVSAKRSIL
ncbi:MAG: carboxypeptidase-like regulatory domain-containing protein, partial [Saprospiraceae bacterium]